MSGGPLPSAVPDLAASGPVVPVPGGQRSSQAWLVTFTDLVALMLTFFVMLFAMSKIEHRQWQNLTDALAQDLDAVREGRYEGEPGDAMVKLVREGANLDELSEVTICVLTIE